MGRAPCCDKSNVKKGPWSPEEDAKLKSHIEKHGTSGNWISLPQRIGLRRCGKSCRLRWLNYLRPNIRHGGFTEEEDSIICSLYMAIGSRWSIIAAQLPGRTDNDIKNYWNTRLKKKLLGKTRKDHQQRPRQNPPMAGASKQVPAIPELSASPHFSYLPDIRAEDYYPSALPSLPIGMPPHLNSSQKYDSDMISSPIMNSVMAGNYSMSMNAWIDPGETIPGLQSVASLDDFGGKYMISSCNNSSCTDISNTSWSDITSIVNNPSILPEMETACDREHRGLMQMCFAPDDDFMCFRPV